MARTQIGLRTAYENAGAEGTVAWRLASDAKVAGEMRALCAELAAAIGVVKRDAPDPSVAPKRRAA